MYLKSPKSGLRNPVIFSDDDWGVQSSPKPIVFSFHYHSQKVIGSLGWGFVLSGSFSLLSFLGNCPFWGTTPDHQKTSSGPQGCLENARSSSWCMCCHTNTVAMGPWYFRWQGALGSWMVSCWQLRIIDFWVVVSNICYFEPYLGKWSNLTNIFQRGWNHQLDLVWFGHISLIVSQFFFFWMFSHEALIGGHPICRFSEKAPPTRWARSLVINGVITSTNHLLNG